ncbi:MAG TPA: MerR family transcriptional regulator [Solirubrobacteraceae bacterium]|nr:MerR family transcriptional regulator [Solirubrobacteraceae bacterium]
MQTAVDALTINEAAETTGWSARMLRYIESIGLVEPARSGSGYRLYGPAELQRLSTLRELLEMWELDLGEVGFALRLRRDPALLEAIDLWLAAEPARPEHVSAADWLHFEQEKHQRLLAAAKPPVPAAKQTPETDPDPSATVKPHTTMEIA